VIETSQIASTGLGDDDDILNAYAEPARQVYARFDTEHHAFLKQLLVTGHDPRRFMDAQSQAMPRAMNEEIAVAGCLKRTARCPVNL
jgi:hypothetical protein